MKRVLTLLLSFIFLTGLALPVAAQSDVILSESGELQQGEWEFTNGGNHLTIDLTEFASDEDGSQIVEDYDTDALAEQREGLEVIEHLESIQNCKLDLLEIVGQEMYTGVCANDDFGLFVYGDEQAAVEHVQAQFTDGETDLVPDGYELVGTQGTPMAPHISESVPNSEASPATNGDKYWEGTNSEGDELTVELTALGDDIDGEEVVDQYDPETDAGAINAEFVEEIDAPDGCRMFEYDVQGEAWFIGLCSDDEYGLWAFGTEEDAINHVVDQFAAGEDDLMPDGYEESEATPTGI